MFLVKAAYNFSNNFIGFNLQHTQHNHYSNNTVHHIRQYDAMLHNMQTLSCIFWKLKQGQLSVLHEQQGKN